jgi:hypothetical protein
MGWWKVDDGIELGDGPLDLAEEFLSRFAQEYLDDLSRKPKLAEIVRTIEEALQIEAEELIEEGGRAIVSLSVKTKPRPKKQPIRVGDIFSVPISDDCFGFGYLTPQRSLVELFRLKSAKVPGIEHFREAERIRPRFLVDLTPLEKWKWKVVRNLPLQSEDFVPAQFIVGAQITCGHDYNNGFIEVSSKLRPATNDEQQRFLKLSLVNEPFLVQYLDKLLKDIEPV